ncbi:uncharacterized protein LOC21384403, partial [Morus notabilis]|uniref:uncharacterized protein LOC21384403 n=1 Tax=Morus notabilis TaxID=981085 RepID=UPI000CED366E
MKIFGWMQSKLKNGRHDESSQKPNSKPVNQPGKEEVNEWLYGLLKIGTFGKNDLKEELQEVNLQGNSQSPSEDHDQDRVSDEVGNLRDELNSLLHKQDDQESASATELEQVLLHRQSSLETERFAGNDTQCCNESSNKSGSLRRRTSLVLSRGKQVSMDNAKNAIGKKSFSFLLKKVFVCGSGFPFGPSPKAPIPESIMEMILRAMLHKKIYPQSSSPSLSAKKYLENGHIPKSKEDDITEKADKGSKWVKTDSE